MLSHSGLWILPKSRKSMFHLKSLFGLGTLTMVTTVFSGLYGLYAVVTDFHETRNGKRVLSRAGRIGVAMLLTSGALNIWADGHKKKEEAAAQQEVIDRLNTSVDKAESMSKQLAATKAELDVASKDIKDTSSNTNNVLGRTGRLLDQTRRSMLPLTDLEADAEVAIPLSQKLLARYGDRVRRETAPLLSGPPVKPGYSAYDARLKAMVYQDYLYLLDDSFLLPVSDPQSLPLGDSGGAEDIAYRLIQKNAFRLFVDFYRGDRVEELLGPYKTPDSDMEMLVEETEKPSIEYVPKNEALTVHFHAKPKIERQSEGFVSMPDFANSTAELTVSNDEGDARLVLVPKVTLRIGKGYRLLLGVEHCRPSPSRVTYVCRIPAGVEPKLEPE
jgi:hypothetical protein